MAFLTLLIAIDFLDTSRSPSICIENRIVGQELKNDTSAEDFVFSCQLSFSRDFDEPVPPRPLILRHQNAVTTRYFFGRDEKKIDRSNPQQASNDLKPITMFPSIYCEQRSNRLCSSRSVDVKR